MVVFLPRGWGEVVSPRDGVSVCTDYSTSGVRDALHQGERLFLVGADALGESGGWCFAKDHITVFGTGDLAGPNDDSLGPRFPNLRGMYVVPERLSASCAHPAGATVMRVPDIRYSTGAELRGFPCDALVSRGLDLAVTAAHGGGKVIFLLNCRDLEDKGENSFSFLNRVIQEIEGGEE